MKFVLNVKCYHKYIFIELDNSILPHYKIKCDSQWKISYYGYSQKKRWYILVEGSKGFSDADE